MDIITCKKGKVSVHVRIFTYKINALKQKTDIRIKFCDMKKRSVKISVKIRIYTEMGINNFVQSSQDHCKCRRSSDNGKARSGQSRSRKQKKFELFL